MSYEIELGLGDPPVRRYLFVGQDEGDSGACWYEYNFNSNAKLYKVPRALTGYLRGLRLKTRESEKFGDKVKLDILMDCGPHGQYAIRTGANTVFARGVILALADLGYADPENLKEPLAIEVVPSTENKKIVLGAVYRRLTGERVKAKWDAEVDLESLITYLQTLVGDGGQSGDEHQDEDYESRGPRHSESPEPREPSSSGNGSARPAGMVSEGQLIEFRRLASTKSMGEDELQDTCMRIYGRVTEGLSISEGIEFRKTLASR